MQPLKEGRADPAHVARALLRHQPGRAKFEKVASFGAAHQHFIDGQEDLIRFQIRAQAPQRLDCTRRLRPPRRKHPVLISS